METGLCAKLGINGQSKKNTTTDDQIIVPQVPIASDIPSQLQVPEFLPKS